MRREYGDGELPSQGELEQYLREDLLNDLRWLFDAAVIWMAAQQRGTDLSRIGRHADVHTMHATVTLARSLYEFFFDRNEKYSDDARARHFCPRWDETPTTEYAAHFAPGQSANKRVSHPIYGRSQHSGGTGSQGPDHLNQRVVAVARDLRHLAERFVSSVAPEFTSIARGALDGALAEAEDAAAALGANNPVT